MEISIFIGCHIRGRACLAPIRLSWDDNRKQYYSYGRLAAHLELIVAKVSLRTHQS